MPKFNVGDFVYAGTNRYRVLSLSPCGTLLTVQYLAHGRDWGDKGSYSFTYDNVHECLFKLASKGCFSPKEKHLSFRSWMEKVAPRGDLPYDV